MTWGFLERGAVPRHAGRAMGAALALTLCVPAQAQEVASATATTQAVVVAPATLVKVQDMSFGRIVARPQAGTVTVNGTTGACTVTGPILEVGTCRQAIFAGMGTKNMRARISLDSVVSLTGPGQAMVLDQVFLSNDATISFSGNPNANGQGVGLTQGNGNQRYTIASNSGIFTLKIGGRLNVNANQLPGIYTGSITVTVQYQ
ncbi:DUF4402 domain-containing protein [Novosphingobium arvoryzae]|uniref:DUF4402 domain-containing protein n=1 Tax=Novosphingobium arvoryzae TaxID=1256514 RepID=A0A918RJ85_9SPHN|nr:DUF4402 domain-containing protein [Novosphingobium arvoryzae]GHA00962.1 hypothetical protein GCM10011617_22050 [Novosphingobium arvoryzae]